MSKQPRKKNGYKMPDPIKVGTILKDAAKKCWCLGESVGRGGFGEIYSACEMDGNKPKSKTYSYAIKVEPIENGPLFVEQSVFLKCCKKEMLDEWKKEKGLKFLGIPTLCGIGTYEQNDKKYRFLVMDKFGKNVWDIFLEQQRHLSTTFIINCALQLLDALEYLHSKEYIHGDIKGANLLLSLKKSEENKVYLLDYGIASKVSTEPIFKRNPKCAHNGTIEYISRDMHLGVPTRRSDLECLGYNLLHWFTSSLPWEDNKNCDAVFTAKTNFMDKLKTIKMSNTLEMPAVLNDYMTYVCKLGHLDVPDYSYCRNIFNNALLKETEILANQKKGKRSTSTPSKEKNKKLKVNGETSKSEVESDAEEEDIQPKAVVKRGRKAKTGKSARTPSPRKKATWRDAPVINLGSPEAKAGPSSVPSKGRRGAPKKEVKPKPESPPPSEVVKRGRRSQSEPKEKVSWRDCSTIVNGNVVKPGVYKRKAK